MRSIVGALLTWGLLACVAGEVVSVMAWVNPPAGQTFLRLSGKTGVLVAAWERC